MQAVVPVLLWLVAGIAIAYLVVMAIVLAIVIGFFLGTLYLGLLSVAIAKSSRGLVREASAGSAALMSLGWAAVLTVGSVLGSFGLMMGLNSAIGPEYATGVWAGFVAPPEHAGAWGAWMLLDQWLFASAYSFFVKVAIIIFLANRIFLARQNGGTGWLGILPPLAGLIVFFAVDHWEIVRMAFWPPSVSGISVLGEKLMSAISLPIWLLKEAFLNPDVALGWAKQKLLASNGSMFKLAELLPSIFWIIAIAFAMKAAIPDAADNA